MSGDVAAVVVSYRTGPRLKECLYALDAQVDISKIIIVDNGNPPDMKAWLEKFAARRDTVIYDKTGENLGFGRAVNRGARQSAAEHLLIVNPDCVIRHDSIAPLLEAGRGQASPCIIGGRIFGIDGKSQRGPRRQELTLRRALSKLVGGAGINLPLEPQPEGPVPVEVTSGAFFMIDRAGFERLGGFDEGFFLHVEDIDLCKRALQAGGTVIYQPLAGALHFGATSDVSSLFVERHKAAGFARYFRNHARGPGHRLAAELLIPLISAGLILRAWLGGRLKRSQ